MSNMLRRAGSFPPSLELVECRWMAVTLRDAGLDPDRLRHSGVNITLLAGCLYLGLMPREDIAITVDRTPVVELNASLEQHRDRLSALREHPDSFLDQLLSPVES